MQHPPKFAYTVKTNIPYLIIPRVIRLRDAPYYLGMRKDYFNKHVRPALQAIAIGQRGLGFDRLDLDEWLDHYKSSTFGSVPNRGEELWDRKNCQDSLSETGCGTSTKQSSADAFARALEQVKSQKRKIT